MTEQSEIDPRVASAAAHWGPRFVNNGTDYLDFERTLARIARWEDWCREWGRTAEDYEAIARQAEEDGRQVTAAEAWRRAGLCWHWAKFVFVIDPVQQREASDRAVADYAKGLGTMRPPAQRVAIPYGETSLPAYLRLPVPTATGTMPTAGGSTATGTMPTAGGSTATGTMPTARGSTATGTMPTAGGPPPVVVMAPGLDSVKEELQATAEYFLARGMATLAVDGPGQGESEYELPIEPAYEKVATAAVDYCEGQAALDSSRIGFFGVSLGGYYAARAMAYEPRLVAGVALAGPYRFDLEWDHLPPMTRDTFRHRSRTADDAAARAYAATLTLEDAASNIAKPTLVVHGAQDRLVGRSHADRLAAEAPGAELLMYEDGNHGVANRAFESRSTLADWMGRHLGAVPPASGG